MPEDGIIQELNGQAEEHDIDLDHDGDHDREPPLKKPKRFQCHHCQRFFARLEHLQRHERTRKVTAISETSIVDACTRYARETIRLFTMRQQIHSKVGFSSPSVNATDSIQVTSWFATRDSATTPSDGAEMRATTAIVSVDMAPSQLHPRDDRRSTSRPRARYQTQPV